MSGEKNISQQVNIGKIKSGRDTIVNPQIISQTQVTNTTQFIEQLNRLITQLNDHVDAHSDVKEVVDQLTAAKEEAEKPSPKPSKIRGFLHSAKGLLQDAAAMVQPLIPLVKTVDGLTKLVPDIFGG